MTEKIEPLFYLGQTILKADLEIVSGLHIGAGKDAIEIGGIDSPVVKMPNGRPYVPGSSIKGKLRFLLEWAFGKIERTGEPWGSGKEPYRLDDPVLRTFGTAAKKEAWCAGPTRLLMRDAMPSEAWKNSTSEFTEEKTEVAIDRIAGKALGNIGPRHVERVPPGASFDFEATFRLYSLNNDNGRRDKQCLAWLIQGLDLLEQDALGGSGSRGYGRVRFSNLRLIVAGKEKISLDNVFRGHVFSRDNPPDEIFSILQENITACGPKSG